MNKKILVFALVTFFLHSFTISAIPALRQWRTVTQPDGTSLDVMLVGDEMTEFFQKYKGLQTIRDIDNDIYKVARKKLFEKYGYFHKGKVYLPFCFCHMAWVPVNVCTIFHLYHFL